MKRTLRIVLSLVLLLCVFGMNAQRQANYNVLTSLDKSEVKTKAKTPEVKVMNFRGGAAIYMIDEYHFPYDLSDNGQHVAIQGFGESSSYYWSQETGIIPMDGYAFAISDNGVIAGYYEDGSLGANVAGLWFPDVRQWSFLGMNPDAPEIVDFDYNSAWAMTNDGSTLAVVQIDPSWNTYSYLWTETDGYVRLDHGSSQSSRPQALNHDATVIAGHGVGDLGWTPCYWANGEFHEFSQYYGEALAVSDNGDYIAGYLEGQVGEAFVYNITTDEFVTISDPQGNSLSATCVNNNGDVFGYSASGFPPMPDSRRAFAYSSGQLMTFNEYLAMQGFEEAENWTFYSINSVTADGKKFSGAANIDGTDHSLIIILEESDCDGPTDLTYTVNEPNYTDVVLSWTAPENPVDVTYEIYTSYTATEPLVSGITETTYTIEGLAPGTYSYAVRANWGGECLSSASNMVNPTIYSCPPSQMCDLTIEMRDEFGDGWNGAYIEITGAGNGLLYHVELKDGNTQTVNLPFCSELLSFSWVAGEWDEEIGFTIYKDEEVLYNIDAIEAPLGTFLEYDIVCYDDVEEIEMGTNIAITPNPAYNFFNVAAENIIEVEIYNSIGQTIQTIKADSNSVQVNTSSFENGVYFVKVVTSDNNATVKKVVISK